MNAKQEAGFKKLQNWLDKLLPEDSKKITFSYEPGLSYVENKEILRERVKKFIDNKTSVLKAQEELRKQIRNPTGIAVYYKDITRAISKLVQGYNQLVFVKGNPGLGKTRAIRRVLNNHNSDYVEITGDVTEAYLYRLFYEHNGKIIWFQDVAKILRYQGAVSLLKSATETEAKKLLTKSNYSTVQADLPPSFVWTGKIIFDYNCISGFSLKLDLDALITRGDYVELNLSMDDVKDIMRKIAKTPIEIETTEFIIKHYKYMGYELLNLRTQWRALNTRKWADLNGFDWRKEVMEEIKTQTKIKRMLYSLIGNNPIKTLDLKKLLIRSGTIKTLSTADRRVIEWLALGEIYQVTAGQRNFYISLLTKDQLIKKKYNFQKIENV